MGPQHDPCVMCLVHAAHQQHPFAMQPHKRITTREQTRHNADILRWRGCLLNTTTQKNKHHSYAITKISGRLCMLSIEHTFD